jgi:hypothetical protein
MKNSMAAAAVNEAGTRIIDVCTNNAASRR